MYYWGLAMLQQLQIPKCRTFRSMLSFKSVISNIERFKIQSRYKKGADYRTGGLGYGLGSIVEKVPLNKGRELEKKYLKMQFYVNDLFKNLNL